MCSKLKVAVIGCGMAAKVDHIRWYAMHPDVDLVALADPNPDAVKFCAQHWGGKVYIDVESMLKAEKPDLVSVCSPVAKHCEHTVIAADHGAHVFTEKPMAPTIEECDRMIEVAERNKVKLGVAFHKRYNVGTEEIQRRIKAGDIGQPIFGRTHWTMYAGHVQGFRGKLETGGGCFQDHGSHWIDQYRWWIGEVSTVQGMIDIFYPQVNEVEDHAVAILGFKSGFNATIETSWVGPAYEHGQLEDTWIYGTEGAFYISLPPWTNYQPPLVRQWVRDGNYWRSISFPADMLFFGNYHYKRQIDDLINRIKDGRQLMATGADGRKAMEAILALYQSHEERGKISLPLSKSPDVKSIFRRLRDGKLQRG
jgi:predicted dehydrogenase